MGLDHGQGMAVSIIMFRINIVVVPHDKFVYHIVAVVEGLKCLIDKAALRIGRNKSVLVGGLRQSVLLRQFRLAVDFCYHGRNLFKY